VRLLALYWDPSSQPPSAIFNICAERVRTRGANHQTLRADPNAPPPGTKPGSSSGVYEDVIWKFIRESEELLPSEVDGVIDMPIGEPLDESVRRAVTGVVKELGLTMPSEEKIKEGIEQVMTYKVEEKAKKPDAVGADKLKKNGKGKETFRYFGFLPEIDIKEVLDPLFASSEDADFWNHLKMKRMVAVKPHVTIVHRKEFSESKMLWERCEKLVDEEPLSEFRLHMTHVVWDGRVMALVVESVTPASRGGREEEVAQKFVGDLSEEERQRFHVTVGTREANISPVEAKALVKGWKGGEENKELKSLSLGPIGVTVKARISGLWS
jgi:tRNA ligase